MKNSPVAVRYLAGQHEAFEATLSAVKDCGYYVIIQDEGKGMISLQRGGSGTSAPGPVFSLLAALVGGVTFGRFVMEIRISTVGAEEIEITGVSTGFSLNSDSVRWAEEIEITGVPTGSDWGEFREITGRVFHRLNEILGEGRLIQGLLEKPGVVNESKKILSGLGIFLIGLVALFAIGIVLGGILLTLDSLVH
jgi:hypothetical protein